MTAVEVLGLRRGDAPARPATSGSTIKGLVEAFLKVFSDFATDGLDDQAKRFSDNLKDIRTQIASSDHEQDIRRIAASAVKACEQFLKQFRHYYASREAELGEMIAILRETARTIAGDSSGFGDQMAATGARLKSMAQLDDIRELKRKLADEAKTLQKAVEDRHKREEQMLSVLTERVDTLQKSLVRAEEQASLDALTNIPNRGAFERSLDKMVKAARLSKTPLSLAIIDIDHFKTINDVHGHPIGDRVLLCAAQWLSAAVQHTDVVARYGGEEFTVLLADADLSTAQARFQTVLEQIASRSFEYEAEGVTKSVRFTVTCGVAQLASQDTALDLVRRADQALYEAKHQGRNRIVAKKRSLLGGLFG